MTTLEEASRTWKRNRTFVGRPQPIRSGIKLTNVKPAANRSDFLLDDQMFLVKDLQDALENAISCYGNAKSEDDKVLYKIKVDDLKTKCEEMVLVLKVVDKIDRELMYARVELTQAAKVGRNVQVARKRVAWLEDRKEKLLMKYRRPPSSRLQKIEKSAFVDESDSDEDYPAKIPTSADAALPDPYSSNYCQHTFSSLDPVLPTSPVLCNKSKNRVDHSLPQNVFPESSFESLKEVLEAKRLKKKLPLKQRPKSDGAGRVVFKPEKSILKSSQSSRSCGGDAAAEVGASQYREQTEVSIYPQNSVTTVNTPEVYSEISDSRPSTRHRSMRQKTSSQQQRTGNGGSDGGVFLTEGVEEDEVRVSRKVSVISPQRSDDEEEDDDEEDAEEEFYLTRGELQPPPSRGRSVATDATEEYWMSDHHRFEYNQFVDALTKDNPRSYHSLGIAVQSTFMSPANTGGPELPWLDGVTAGNMGDAQSLENVTKIALDKLSERIHKLYSKVEDAAMQSAQLTPTPVEREPTLLTTMEGRMNDYPQKQGFDSKPESSKSLRSISVTGANNNETTSDPATEDQASETQSQKMNQAEATVSDHVKQQGAAGLGLLYHPPAIPAPEVLPLTRTNPSKIYPRISSDWNDVDSDPIPPTIRLVNQMNVAKETSLLLYKNKESKRTGFTLPVKKKSGKKSQPLKKVTLVNHPILAASKVAAMMANRKSADALKLDKDSLKWKRIENLIYEKLISENVQERRDAAMHLGSLKCVNEEVFAALIQRVEEDKDAKVRYSASKSLISLGCWRPVPITALLNYLKSSDQPIQLDVVKTIIAARNVHFVNKNQPGMKKLIEKLKEFCQSATKPELAYHSAVCLGCLCEQNRTAKRKLLQSLQDKDSNIKAQSLEILVRQMHATESEVVQTILTQLQTSPVGRHRSAAAKLLIFLGSVCIPTQEAAQNVFSVLEQRLYNDPVKDVRLDIANAITALGMKSWLMDIVEKHLEYDDDSVRTSAVISVGVLGMKSDKVIRVLIDMLELDSSEYVRLMVIRTFAQLGATSIKIMRSLKDKERSGGPLGREASNALKILQGLKSVQGSRKSPRNAGLASPPRSPLRVASPNRAASPARHRSSATMNKNRKEQHIKS